MQAGEKWVALPNQVRLSYWEQGDPLGVALILLPGLADSWRTFKLLFLYLPPSIHTIAFDQRGNGNSSRPESGYQTADFVGDLVLFMDALHIEKAVILGASSGGFAARSFALEHPERTLGLVLLGTPASLRDNPAALEAWDSTISRLKDPVDPEFVRRFTQNQISQKVPPEFLEKMVQESLKVPARVWRETTAGLLAEQFSGELAQIQAPALIIWGEEDAILSRSSQEALAEVIPGARLIIHPGAGHALYWEIPQLISSDIAAFIMESKIKNDF
jgi:pimeloyl-ACP methyl ester carboxylesterase